MSRRPCRRGVVPLAPHRAAQLRNAEVTAPWDAAAPDVVPPGFRRIEHTAPLARRDLDGAVQDLLPWRMHTRAGLEVAVDPGPDREGAAHPGDVIELRLGVGPLGVRAPCRVLQVFEEPDRRGLTYGTLPGHPEAGIERFEVVRAADGALRLRISGYSRPGSPLVRAGAPLARIVQERITRRYLRALDEG
ncbi:DUF1990 domain-containing protein [Brachybacterium sp. MASK1Z-5]|uniref:DUF1990 domain-containing protein n=1 Tax=Brachybacterium halotolerans TaxID=2795215 RepID=A0ABS1B9R0_9MICO|nr:DUF1990 domain-containing protein [Brachybacterium halotolerans]MBK0331399.1 DUF1990 domain-containing protein [Brachybacterium halotolerans]